MHQAEQVPGPPVASPRLRVAIAGSKLFAPTLTSLAAAMARIAGCHDVKVFAKYPRAHPLGSGLRLQRVEYEKCARWPHHFDLAHLIAGDTAERILEMLPEDFPIVLTCESGGDFTRRMQSKAKAAAYSRQFARATLTIFIHQSTADLARRHCDLESSRAVVLDPCLPLASYRRVIPSENEPWVAVVGREVPEKGRIEAQRMLILNPHLKKVFFIGAPPPAEITDERFRYTGIIPHEDYLTLLARCRALLYVGSVEGERYDVLPTTFLEAFAVGVPVVATPVLGARDIAARFPEFLKLGNSADELAGHLSDVLLRPPSGSNLADYACNRFSLTRLVTGISDQIYPMVASFKAHKLQLDAKSL